MCHGDEVSFLVRHFREIELVMGLAWMVVRGQPAGAPGCSLRDFVNIHPLLRPGSDLIAVGHGRVAGEAEIWCIPPSPMGRHSPINRSRNSCVDTAAWEWSLLLVPRMD